MANAELAQRDAAEVRFDGVCKSLRHKTACYLIYVETGGVYCLISAGQAKPRCFARCWGTGAVRCRVNNRCSSGRYFRSRKVGYARRSRRLKTWRLCCPVAQAAPRCAGFCRRFFPRHASTSR